MTPFLLLFGIGGVVFVLILLLICKRKRYEQEREQEKGRRRGNTLRDSAVTLAALGMETSTPMTAASRGDSRAASVDSAFELPSRRSVVATDDVRKDPDFENLRIAQSDIDRQHEIAKGGGGIVYLALLLSTNEQVVLKQMYPDKVKKNHHVIEQFMMEIRLCSRLKHDKIVAFRGIAWSSLVDLSMVIEYMPNGDLAQFLERQRLMDPEREGWCWSSRESAGYGRSKLAFALDVSDAVLYLHSFSDPVIHRDLKAQNVLLSKTWVAKLSDFGASRVKSGSETAMQMTAEVGTVAWIAPEIIRGDKYDQQADIYSFGVVLCEIDTCAKPFAVGMCTCNGEAVEEDAEDDGEDPASRRRSSRGGIMGSNAILAMAVSEDRVRPAFHRDCPRAIRALGLRCMSGDPRERPTAKEVYSALRTIEEQDRENVV
jgi:serine/threonine protein kinase